MQFRIEGDDVLHHVGLYATRETAERDRERFPAAQFRRRINERWIKADRVQIRTFVLTVRPIQGRQDRPRGQGKLA